MISMLPPATSLALTLSLNFRMLDFSGVNIKFEREALKKSLLLDQIDKKFIAAVISPDPGKKFLVLFDQHAVHERIRVENLLSGNMGSSQFDNEG